MDDYIVNVDQISDVLQFFKTVENPVMSAFASNSETNSKLRDSLEKTEDGRPYCADMFIHMEASCPTKSSGCLEENAGTETLDGTGGPSLLRTNEEMETAVFMSATVVIGDTQQEGANIHEKVAEALCDDQPLPQQKTYAVRPIQDFASDSSPDWLESHYPDLFPYGRGGFGETRQKQLSRAAILQRLLHLSDRQFQNVDFVLPCYDLVTKMSMKQITFVRAKLPSYQIGADGIRLSKAEAFGKVSLADMRLVGDYKKECANAASKGIFQY